MQTWQWPAEGIIAPARRNLPAEVVLSLCPPSQTSCLNTFSLFSSFFKNTANLLIHHILPVSTCTVLSSQLFFFFIPTFVVCLSDWDCRLGTAACNTYFSHFAVIECSTYLFIFFAQSPSYVTVTPGRLYLLLCARFLLFST